MEAEKSSAENYIPKKATQQEEFLQKYPEFDGRGLLIAVMDFGVDISSPELQKTSEGLPKIIDSFNFNKDVKIDTSVIREVDTDNILIGLSGKKLKIPSFWKNPSGKWHLGIFLSEGDTEVLNKKEAEEMDLNINKSRKGKTPIIIDCIVWFDGEEWRGCINTTDELKTTKVFTNYSGKFPYINDFVIFIEIQDDGNSLEIVYNVTDHGTIVANVAAANFPADSQRNGLAPGAQIVTITMPCRKNWRKKKWIAFFKKAISECIKMKVDIINISVKVDAVPKIAGIIEEATEKYGIIIVYAAGNDGPTYSSFKEKYWDCFDKMFVIGSVFTPEMQKKQYNIDSNETLLFSTSSKGPFKDGQRGIDFVAPGDVIFGNDGYIRGTSFAAPNFGGSIACLLSALKANSINYNPTMLKMALSNTAILPEGGNKLGFGDGIIQIDSAFEYLKTFSNSISTITFPKLTLFEFKKKTLNKLNQNGIILHQKHSDRFCKQYTVKIGENEINNNEILWTLKITSDGEKFVEYSDTVKDGMFTVNINTNSLNPGSINYAEIQGFDSSNPSIGPLFKLPITVIVSKLVMKKENNIFQNEINLKVKIPYSIFLHSPSEDGRCIVKITALENIETETGVYLQCAIKKGSRAQKHLVFTPEEKCKSYYIPETLRNQMLEISICACIKFKNLETSIKFNLEIIFEKNSVTKIQKKTKNKNK